MFTRTTRYWSIVLLVVFDAFFVTLQGCPPGTTQDGPIAAFVGIPRSGVAPLEVNFADFSAAGSSEITQWHWNFGDGTEQVGAAQVLHVYDSPGLYTVTLRVVSSVGMDEAAKQDYVEVFAPQVVLFEDSDVELEVRLASGVLSGPLYESNLASVEVLILPEEDVSSLSGLQACRNLRSLTCRNCPAIPQPLDLSPLAPLTHLEILDFQGTKLESSLEGLEGKNTLRELNLLNSGIDLSVAAATLATLTGLRDLNLRSSTNGKAIPFVVGMTALTNLNLENAEVSRLNALAPLKTLRALVLGLNPMIDDLSPLAALNQLESLSAYGCNITNLAPISGMQALQTLTIGSNAISDITPLTNLDGLKTLIIADNSIEDISALSSLDALETLIASENDIEDISPLTNAEALVALVLNKNIISEISALAGLSNLSELSLDDNAIIDISPLAGLTNLTRLSLTENLISDVSPLENLPNLYQLGLCGNSIVDYGPLLRNQGLGEGDHICIYYDGVETDYFCSVYFAFRERGVDIGDAGLCD